MLGALRIKLMATSIEGNDVRQRHYERWAGRIVKDYQLLVKTHQDSSILHSTKSALHPHDPNLISLRGNHDWNATLDAGADFVSAAAGRGIRFSSPMILPSERRCASSWCITVEANRLVLIINRPSSGPTQHILFRPGDIAH